MAAARYCVWRYAGSGTGAGSVGAGIGTRISAGSTACSGFCANIGAAEAGCADAIAIQ
jgi:hypothetical protein